jgi:diguanylate cyclase (GGDEF)-like protein
VLHVGCRAIAETGAPEATETTRRLAEAVAAQLALGVANVKLRDVLRSQSIRDPLTGLFNRRYMEETLEREVRRAVRGRRPIAVLILDLDRFKQVNDRWGHAAGDALLRGLGALLQDGSRREDVACRYGGEEFVLVLPGTSLEDAGHRAEQLRAAVKSLRLRQEDEGPGSVSVSIGVAAYPDHALDTPGLLKAADAALYRAKREGRDRVAIASPGETLLLDSER